MKAFTLSSIFVLAAVAHGRNDWSKPCINGECSYDLPTGNGRPSGSLKIWGSPDAISDVTPAAGWEIIGCSPDALAQDIRLVCKTDDETSTCSHLLRRSAVGKIVRLPENCGKSPFARVARIWLHANQTIPAHIASRLQRRANVRPSVRGLALDTNFALVDPDQTGNVSIAIQGATVPGQNGDLAITDPTLVTRDSELAKRSLWKWIEDAFNKFNNFDEDISKTLTPVDVNKNYPLFDASISCGSFQASTHADLNAQAHAVITVGVAAVGTIIPPKLTEFGLYALLNGNLDGTITLTGNAFGSVDSGLKTLYQVGIPGLDFPGILTIGPTFKVLGQASANLDIGVNAVVDLSYSINNAKLFWPQSNNPSGGIFTPGNTPLTLSVTASAASNALVQAHVMPVIDFGVNALGGIAKATVSLNVDASAQLSLSLNANAQGGISTNVPVFEGIPAGISFSPIGIATRPVSGLVPIDTSFPIATFTRVPSPIITSLPDISLSAIHPSLPRAADSGSASVTGCIDIGAALSVNAGADASFFGLFDKSTSVSLFSKNWVLYDRCFSASTRRDESVGFSRRETVFEKRALSCLTSSSSGLTNVVNTVVTGLS